MYNKMSIVFLGGEPLAEWNRQSVLEISKHFKEKYKDKIENILYSWRYIEDIKNENLKKYVKFIDYGVLGSFDNDKKVIDCIPASTNQYIYDFYNNKKIKSIKIRR